jgi:integrase
MQGEYRLNDQQIEDLLSAVGNSTNFEKRNSAFLAVLADNGFRLGEMLAFDISDVMWGNGVPVELLTCRREGVCSVRLSQRSAAWLTEWLVVRKSKGIGAGSLFCTISKGEKTGYGNGALRPGLPLSKCYIRQVLARLSAKIGLPKDLTTEDIRHSYVAILVRKTGDPELIRKQLGYRSLQTVSRSFPEVRELVKYLTGSRKK